LSRPVPTPQPVSTLKVPIVQASVPLPWPSYGQSAIGARGYGVLASHNAQSPVPMASIAKIITALAVLKEKPLKLGQQGPKITITNQDLAYYDDYFSKGGSIVPVTLGEQITEYQALQALLIPSANNFADTLARWAFSSPQKYIEYANSFVKTMGMGNTHVADASGLSKDSVSSAEDLVLLGQAALSNPVLAEISKQDKAIIPVAGEVQNTNWLLGTDGVIGIKTGNTDEAGGCYLFAAMRQVEGQPVTVIGSVIGAPTLAVAINDSRALLQAAGSGFKKVNVAKAGQTVGRYDTAWGQNVPVVAQKSLSLLAWQGAPLQSLINLDKLKAPKDKGTPAGFLNVKNNDKTQNVPLILAQPLPGPSLSWRLFR
jgi:serine-type D-Ala-D-Ala carboxypeptidase (penicillin-binding protein 5/6)